jgi:uncharacterized protein
MEAIEWGGERLVLLPTAVLHWPRREMLLVADLHLGKEVSFQAASLPVPLGSTDQTLQRLDQIIHQQQPRTVMILGDLMHARRGATESVVDGLRQLIDRRPEITWKLIEGNHDRRMRRGLADVSLEWLQPPYWVEPFWMLHDAEREFALAVARHPDGRPCLAMAGHVHPAVRVPTAPRRSERVRVFHVQSHCITLPAFGSFTGNKLVEPHAADRVFAIADDQVLPLGRR